jgi:hypothetical protein
VVCVWCVLGGDVRVSEAMTDAAAAPCRYGRRECVAEREQKLGGNGVLTGWVGGC